MSLQNFVYATFLGEAKNYVIEQIMSLNINVVEIFIQSSFGEQSGVRSSTMLFHKVESQISVLSKWVICLLGKCKIEVVKSVMFGISNFVFHCKHPFLKMFSFGINYQGCLLGGARA